ncbi:hypothetical protein [Mesorhizobium mediterraneum]|uniref:hypothetical protein n=1 Tax=Mesorhizobium mediterraneum TaxID=43617 RepID=UPI00177C1480|nr:hypothetical protein [Mesorhizobium mediterraneum]
MSKTGGARPGAGRPKGSLSTRHVELLAGAVSEGVTPVEYMLSIMRNENEDEKRRAWAAEKAAPFIHPRPAPIARVIEIDLPSTDTVEGIKAALGLIVMAAAEGRLAPSEAQSLSALIEAQRKAIETGELLERIERLEAQGDGRAA